VEGLQSEEMVEFRLGSVDGNTAQLIKKVIYNEDIGFVSFRENPSDDDVLDICVEIEPLIKYLLRKEISRDKWNDEQSPANQSLLAHEHYKITNNVIKLFLLFIF